MYVAGGMYIYFGEWMGVNMGFMGLGGGVDNGIGGLGYMGVRILELVKVMESHSVV